MIRTVFALALAVCALPVAVTAEADNPACHLLTEADAGSAFGSAATESVINPEMTGVSDCSWVSADGASIAISRAAGLAFQGNATAEVSYRTWRDGFAAEGAVEDLEGVGEKAFLFIQGESDSMAYVVGILRSGTTVIMGTSQVTRPSTLKLARWVAGRM